jgi:hypothetical protein
LKDVAVVMDLDEFAPVGGRPASGTDGRRFERFAEVGENLPDRSGLRDERDQSDVAAARRALERKLLPHPGHEFRPCNPGGVVRAGLCMGAAAILSVVPDLGVPACCGISPLAAIPDRQSGDGPPQRVVRREDAVIPVPVPPRLRDQIRSAPALSGS